MPIRKIYSANLCYTGSERSDCVKNFEWPNQSAQINSSSVKFTLGLGPGQKISTILREFLGMVKHKLYLPFLF